MAKAHTAISEPTNGGKEAIETGLPYTAHVTIVGSADLLLHAWNCEAVDEKAKAKKGHKYTWLSNSDSLASCRNGVAASGAGAGDDLRGSRNGGRV